MTDRRLQMPLTMAQVLVKYSLDGQPCENVLYCVHQHRDTVLAGFSDAAFDADNAAVVGARIKTWLTGNWAYVGHAKAQATEVDVIWNTAVGAGPLAGVVVQDGDFPIVGTNIGEPLPNNCTIAVEWRTAVLGRSYHGRTYVVGLNDGHIDATAPNQLKPTSLTEIPATYNALRDAMTAVEFETMGVPDEINDRFPLVVASFKAAGVDRTPAIGTIVTAATLSDPYLDSMRRRLPGHNRHGRRR